MDNVKKRLAIIIDQLSEVIATCKNILTGNEFQHGSQVTDEETSMNFGFEEQHQVIDFNEKLGADGGFKSRLVWSVLRNFFSWLINVIYVFTNYSFLSICDKFAKKEDHLTKYSDGSSSSCVACCYTSSVCNICGQVKTGIYLDVS